MPKHPKHTIILIAVTLIFLISTNISRRGEILSFHVIVVFLCLLYMVLVSVVRPYIARKRDAKNEAGSGEQNTNSNNLN